MKLLLVFAVFAFSICLTIADDDPLADVSSAIDSFSFSVYKSLNYQKDSLTYSQIGMAMALGMILRGAKSNTAAEIKQILYSQNIPDEAIHTKLLRLLNDELNKPRKDLTLRVGNMALVSKDIPMKDDYVKFIENNYHGVVKSVDFKNDGQNIVSTVNDFVSNKTFGMVKKTLESPLSSDTRLALVNSVYIKGSWVNPFPKANTHSAPFNNVDKTITQVDTMHAVLNLKVCRINSTRSTVLVLPLKGKSVVLVYFPDDVNGLPEALINVDHSKVQQCLKAAKEERTNLYLPKFRVEGQSDIELSLSKLGAVSMFDQNKADLTGISDAKPLFVNKMVHKVALNINEDGVDANEANLGASQKSSPGKDNTAGDVRVNRPFAFGIYDYGHMMFVLGDIVNKL